MTEVSYEKRRGELKTYFDRTARDKWVALTSNTPVSRIRETVRAGREEMRNTLLDWLPDDLSGLRILDAGCGTGALSVAAARRGARVLAVDISPQLIAEASRRLPDDIKMAMVDFRVADMADPELGTFDYVVAMDSLIHYPLPGMASLIANLASRTRQGLFFTFAPKTPVLSAMKVVGKIFPRNDRSPAIEPVAEKALVAALESGMAHDFGFRVNRHRFVSTAFYKSQAMELISI